MGHFFLHPNLSDIMRAKDLSFEARGYYLGLVSRASVGGQWPTVPLFAATHITEVGDPRAVLAELERAGMVSIAGSAVTLLGDREWIRKGPANDRLPKVTIPRALRRAAFDRDGWACLACGSDYKLSADHVVPESVGGPTTLENLQTLCKRCNCSKGTKTIDYRPTGQDRPGLEELPPTETRDEIDPWAAPSPPERFLDLRPAPAAGCSWCRNSVVPGCPNCETTMSEVG